VTAQPLVAIEHLSKTFPGQRALQDVSMAIDRHEIHALVGENGSGKSTLIKVLSGFHLPDPGSRILIDGEDPDRAGMPDLLPGHLLAVGVAEGLDADPDDLALPRGLL